MYGESELVIMIAVATEEMHGPDRSPNLQRITRRAWLDEALFQRDLISSTIPTGQQMAPGRPAWPRTSLRRTDTPTTSQAVLPKLDWHDFSLETIESSVA